MLPCKAWQWGETKFATLPPAEAYGEADPENMLKVPAADVPEDIQPEVGMMLTLTDDYGRNHQVVVAEVTPEYIVLDANHHLAGKSLVFEITMVSIN